MKEIIAVAALFVSGVYLLRHVKVEPVTNEEEATEWEPDPQAREHVDGPDCWCQPVLFFDGMGEFGNVWVHKGHGEELPPSWILADAIASAIAGDIDG